MRASAEARRNRGPSWSGVGTERRRRRLGPNGYLGKPPPRPSPGARPPPRGPRRSVRGNNVAWRIRDVVGPTNTIVDYCVDYDFYAEK